MFNTLSHSTHRRWTIFYGAAAALLAGWLFFEKMPDGRAELAGSVEGTFWGSREAMVEYNKEMMPDIQDGAEDYPSPQAEEYKNRAERALALVAAFEKSGTIEGFCSLRDSFLIMADSNSTHQATAAGFRDVNLTNQQLKKYKSLKESRLFAGGQALASSVLNYISTKTVSYGEHYNFWGPGFGYYTVSPMAGEAFQAEIILSEYYASGCADFTCFFNDQPLPIKEGVAHFRTTFPTPGPHTLRLRFRRERCRDGSVTEVSRDFKVNVLPKCSPND